jgi:4-amino-4-deoxy-L-arabinose transferase-like glycosyltransferase
LVRSRTLFFVLLAAIPVIRIVSTYRVFSQTSDEPFHVAAGYQWLTTPKYDLDPEHPPLARVFLALDAALSNAKPEGAGSLSIGNSILERNSRYRRNLFGARLGNLPFFLLSLTIVGLWTKRLFGDAAAIVAIALFGALPPILGHAGLATTDMAAAATTVTALYVFDRWIDEPSWSRAIVVAFAIGAGVLAKFSFLIFFPSGALVLLLARRRFRVPHAALMMLMASAIVWAGYKFSTGSLNDARLKAFIPGQPPHTAAQYATTPGYEWVRLDLLERYYHYSEDSLRRAGHGVDFVDWAKAAGYPSPQAGRHGNTLAGSPPIPTPTISERLLEPFRQTWQHIAIHDRIPAPMFFAGLEMVKRHSSAGNDSFLLGQFRDHGWWYYFPVILFFKTPPAFIALALIGIIAIVRTRNPAAIGVALAPIVMLLPVLTTGINIGVRHVLPLYPVLTIAAAFAVVTLWQRWRVATVLLLSWFFISTALAHPDYMSYFNEAAGSHPERIALDSNLDWGQDLLRLADIVQREHIDHLYLSYFGTANWRTLLPAAQELPQFTHVHGWVAISENQMIFGWPTNRRDAYTWLRKYEPARRVGKSIRLYRIP